MRFSKSTNRGPTKTGCVCESTKPGRTTLPVQSISVTFFRFFLSQGSRRASLVVPTETIFPPMHRTAPWWMMPSSLRLEARRGPGVADDDRKVSSSPTLMSSRASGLRTHFLTTPCLCDSVVSVHECIIGTFTFFFFAKSCAAEYPASAWRMIPMPGSVVSTRSMRLAMASVPSATVTCPACSE